ncbi:MAG: hypothetical protein U1E86_13480 [Burkholderiaceae bacterium]
MAERVVDRLEAVEVDEDDRDAPIVPARQRERARQPVVQVLPVGQLGERVVQRQELDAFLRLLAGGDVAHDDHALLFPAELRQARDQLDRDPPTARVDHHRLVRLFPMGLHALRDARPPVFGDELERVLPDQRGGRVAAQRDQRLVDVGDEPVAMEQDALAAGLHELSHPLLALADGALGVPRVGDVVDHHEGAQQLACVREVRDQADLDDPLVAVRQRLLAHVARFLPRDHRVDVGLDVPPRGFADRLANGLAEDRLRRPPVVLRVAAIGEAAAQGADLVVRHQGRDGVGDQAQQGAGHFVDARFDGRGVVGRHRGEAWHRGGVRAISAPCRAS